LEEHFEILISVPQKLQKLILQNPACSLETQNLVPQKVVQNQSFFKSVRC